MLHELPLERSDGSPGSAKALAELNAAFLDDRNHRMAKAITEFLEAEGDTFVVVGAAHLVGDQGVPALLRAAGHEVGVVAP